MQLVLAGDFAVVREKYIEVIEHTNDMMQISAELTTCFTNG